MGGEKDESVAWFAPDTNFFLQCKSPEELDWSLATDANKIVLVAMRTVQREVDNLKGQGNQRRAARARAVAVLFGNLVSTDDVHVYREAAPRVVMQRAPRLNAAREKPAGFDVDNADDRVVEEVMASAEVLGASMTFITQDSGPIQTAHDFGLPCIRTPDAWLLAPEPDFQTRQMAEVKRRLDALEKQVPKITVEARQDGQAVRIIKGEADGPAMLSDSFIARVRKEVTEHYPRLEKPPPGGGVTFLREGELRQYWNNYDAWLEGLFPRMQQLAEAYDNAARPVRFRLHLNNMGRATATHPRIEVTVEGPLRLISPRVSRSVEIGAGRVFQSPPMFPTLPSRPQQGLARLTVPPPPVFDFSANDPPGKTFRWVYAAPEGASKRASAECIELRHGLDGFTFDFDVLPEAGKTTKAVGVVKVRVSAPNLPEPFSAKFRVEIERRERGVEDRVRAKLEEELGVRILQLRDLID